MVQSLGDARLRQQAAARTRVPPHNVQAEQSLLGAMLLSRDAIVDALEVCGGEDFYKPAHAHVFGAITSLYAQGEPVDPVTVADELSRAGLLDVVGGTAALIELQASTPATSNASRYARIVEEHALLRRLIGVAGEIAELGYSMPEDVGAAVDRAEAMVFDVAKRRVADSTRPLRELLSESLDRLEQLYDRGESITGVPTGFIELDERLSGLQKSNLVIVGARPGAGKTSLALGMAAHAAIEARVPVLLFSLEMSHLEITQRLLCAEARVDSTRMRNGRLVESDWPKIAQAIGRLGEAPIFVDDNPMATIMDIRAKARRMKSREGLGLVIIDYLQLMSGRSSAENRQVEVSEISRGLKILARELSVPVVALSQLSRNLEMRADKRPVLADLRESGCLTADARVLRADTGAEVTMGELLARGETDIPVWSLDEDLLMVPATMRKVFPTGVKPVFQLCLASGRRLSASANHPFLTLDGWTRVDELAVGERVAVPRRVPDPLQPKPWPEHELVLLAHLLGSGCGAPGQPLHYATTDVAAVEAVERAAERLGAPTRRVRQGSWWYLYFPASRGPGASCPNPVATWLARLGLPNVHSQDRAVPAGVFGLPRPQLARFLAELWSAYGVLSLSPEGCRVAYPGSGRRLVEDLQHLLLRFDVQSRIVRVPRPGRRPVHELRVEDPAGRLRFLEHVVRRNPRRACLDSLVAATRRPAFLDEGDVLPDRVWDRVRDRAGAPGLAAVAPLGAAPTRVRVAAAGEVLHDDNLRRLAASQVVWDPIVAIRPLGLQPVYDATVRGTHNFVANGVISENSLEQDADVVIFLYRDELYNEDSPQRGTAEVIVAKHRNGPTGKTELAFLEHYSRFANMARI